ncbi:MAG: TIM barrel protein [Clostridiales bacterium]|nr:TIM barrel protein [Clostridiales bacterium]
MKYSVCVSAVFAGVPVHETLPRVKAAGFDAFEFWSWWDQDLDKLDEARRRTGLKTAAFCTRFSSLTDPSERDRYLKGLTESVRAAKRLECPLLISQVGAEQPGVSRQAQHESVVEGLRKAAPVAENAGIILAIEPLNTLVDHKGYYLYSSSEGFDIVDEVGSPNVKLLFDVYHQQITEGNIIENLTKNVSRIAHIHIAGNPGRHEPYENSELDYPVVLRALKDAGYGGHVGLEYLPLRDPDKSLRALLEKMPL